MQDYKVFLICVCVGVGLGAFWGVVNFIKIVLKKNMIINNVLSFFYAIIFGLAVLYTIINLNFGQFRAYLLAAFVLGAVFERKTVGKIFAKIYIWLYNKISKGAKLLAKTKVVKKLLK